MKSGPTLFFFLFSITCNSQVTDSSGIPDYSQSVNWAALPNMVDEADEVPDNSLRNNQDSAEVDVFFIHPTTHLSAPWNHPTEGEILNKLTDKVPIRMQASVFNESCKIFAPRYRQATIFSFFVNSPKADSALKIAYSDVKSAFEFYLKNFNKGRPIIIAGHSQGSSHAVQLLKDFFDGKKLSKLLVAAYIPGWNVKCNEFRNIPVCDSASSTGCFVSWNSFFWGTDVFSDLTKDACCINPISWKADTVYIPVEQHQGSVPLTFKGVDKKAVDAQCMNGRLWVHLPADIRYWLAGLNYHVLDYNLFYLDIRLNVKTRIECYFEQGKMNDYR